MSTLHPKEWPHHALTWRENTGFAQRQNEAQGGVISMTPGSTLSKTPITVRRSQDLRVMGSRDEYQTVQAKRPQCGKPGGDTQADLKAVQG